MQKILERVLQLRAGETRLFLVLGGLLLSNSLAMQMSEIAAISNFLSAGGVNQILVVWLVDAALAIVMTSFQSLFIDRFSRIRMMQGLTLGFAGAFVCLRLMFILQFPEWLNYSLLYLIVGQQLLLFPLIFWILANDVCDMSQCKRLFPIIASWGLIGKLLGIGVAALLPIALTALGWRSEELLLFNVAIYIGLSMLVGWGFKGIPVRQTLQQPESIHETLTEGWNFVKEVDSFRFLMISVVAMILCETVIEFRFLVVSDALFTDPGSYQTFYSLYFLARILISLAVQAFLTRWLIERLNLKNAFFILPFCTLTGISWMIALPGAVSSLGGILLEKIPLYSLDESIRKAFQALVPEERRGRVSIFMDNYLYAGGAILGCLLTGSIVLLGEKFQIESYFYGYLGMAAIASLISIWAIIQMRGAYDSSLLNWRLKRRQRGKGVIERLDLD